MKNLHQIWLKNFLKSWKKLWMTMKIDNKKKMGLFLLGLFNLFNILYDINKYLVLFI